MPETNSTGTLRERLRTLAAAHSQAELARRTGFPPANVHRFLRGGKVPAEFCESLVREMGVNPAWLLAGEGTAYLADVTAETARMGSNLLELVEAMSAVSRMRLGSLTGKHHLRVLRELSDAVSEHERLRQKLNTQSLPVFAKLLEDLEAALDRMNLERAEDLLKATEQVARLCDDDALALRLDAARAQYAFLTGDSEHSATWRRKVFVRQMAGGLEFNETRLLHAQYLVMAVLATGRIAEALRICLAALDLSEGRRTRAWCVLQATAGGLEMDLGDMAGGMARIHRALPEALPVLQQPYSSYQAKFLLFGGLGDIAACLALKPSSMHRSTVILRFAAWLEDADALRVAARQCISPDHAARQTHLLPDSPPALHAAALLDVLADKSHLKQAEKRLEAVQVRDGRQRFFKAAVRTQLRRLAGGRSALEALKEADAELLALPPGVTVLPDFAAVHYRNLRELGERDPLLQPRLAAAREFFRSHYARGFACFKSWAEKA
ncbi:MAG: helix-turn-helix transcriptional regulator [Planctomycetes bacterium]|nr:helix-turn-helix transcriptional regulator [Planctomycetota bacterium]